MTPEPSRLPVTRDARGRPVGLFILLVVVVGLLLGGVLRELGHTSLLSPAWVAALMEDVGGRDFIPNDVYGHLHDELEESLESGALPTGGQASVEPAVPGPRVPVPETAGSRALRDVGVGAVPRLLGLLSSEPTLWERICERVGTSLRVPALLSHANGAAERRRMAAMRGFEILGEQGWMALPELTNLLHQARAPMEVGFVLVGMGDAGRLQLMAALASTNTQVRGAAALALGLDGSGDPRVVRSLLTALDRGHADYQILGAIGRLGGDPDEVARSVSKALLRDPGPSPCSVEARMLACLAGLCGPPAAAALPALERQRLYCPEFHRQIIERAIRRIGVPAPSGQDGTGRRD